MRTRGRGCLQVERVQIRQKLPLRKAEIHPGLLQPEFSLANLAAHRAPIPYGHVEAGHHAGAEIVIAELIVQRVLVGLESVEVVQR